MNNLQYLLGSLAGRWAARFAGVGIAGALIWYLAPFVPALRGVLPRALLLLALVLIAALVMGVVRWFRRRKERALAAAVTEPHSGAPRDTAADAADEVAQLRARLRAALARLRAGGRRGYLYKQPWFVLIGPPGSGKTTALQNAGLHFPPAEDGLAEPVPGVGGTRLCDWWFADEAVLIDTAGRYTTQDSDASIDRAGWEGFLDLLRRTRKRQPINGVIVIIALTEIAAAAPEERAAHARAVRRRVKEISDRLRLRVPVYALFSKADQIVGFNEYFDDQDAETRTQVWGMTFPVSKGVEIFAAEYRLLLEQLHRRLLGRLQGERTADRRALIAGFPLQMASLEAALRDFLNQAFGGTKLDPAPFLRGVYITSATQAGTPIDRLTSMLAHTFGIDQKQTASLRPTTGRSYFLERLLRDVILGEALLVTGSAKMRRLQRLRVAAYACIFAVTVAAALVIWRADAANRLAVERAAEAVAAYRQRLASVTLDPVKDDDLPAVAPLLDAARSLPEEQPGLHAALPGLSQAAALSASNRLVYRHVLERAFLPRLLWRIEQQMHERFDQPDFLYEATRVYLMLGGAGPTDAALIQHWMQADWRVRYPGALNAQMRETLDEHLRALLDGPLPRVSLDDALVAAARATFSRVTLAQRVYSRIRPDAAAGKVAEWTPASVLGPAGAQLFTRPSGKPLTDGIPGFYTAAGFRSVLLPELAPMTRKVTDESWVLGSNVALAPQSTALRDLERDVVAIYTGEYEKYWDGLLDDLALVPFSDRNAAMQSLYVLSSPQSPMRDLLIAIVHELTLAPRPAAQTGETGAAAATVAAETSVSDVGQLEQHFQRLRNFVGEGQTAAPLQNVLGVINALQQELARVGPNAPNAPDALQGSGDPAQLLLAEAQRQPQPVARWLEQIATSGRTMLGGGAQDAAARAFSDSDGPAKLCQAVVNRYPFVAASTQDVPLDDFARLFAPGGLLDSFFQKQIKPFVDTSGTVWKAAPLGGIAPPLNAASLAQFQRAAAIRDMFFPAGGTQPQVRFDIAAVSAPAPVPASTPASTPTSSPASTEGDTSKPTLTLGGTTIAHSDGATAQTTSLTWPGIATASFAFDPGPAEKPLQANGAWALFRLLDHARITRVAGKPEEFRVTFASGGQSAGYTLRAGSSRNPVGQASLLQAFRCPTLR